MVREDSFSSRSIFNGWVRGDAKLALTATAAMKAAHEAFSISPILPAVFEIEIWVVPREFKLSSHDGREFFAFF
ncbi:hypothetical protein [Paenibacillus sp. FJAT-27812]|uniref:hypothetical protein n=1 Tax=Paenibacillus sp. FJAT-27812 TaxID=1684143 RepID=UPI0006A7EDB2